MTHGFVVPCLLAPMWHFFKLLLNSHYCCVDGTGCFVDMPISTSVSTQLKPLLFKIRQSLCVDTVDDWDRGEPCGRPIVGWGGGGGEGREIQFFFFPGVLLRAILWVSSWRHIAQGVPSAVWIALCCTHLPDQPPLPEFVASFGILCTHRMRIWRFPQCFFPALYPPWFEGSTFLLSRSWASFLPMIHSVSSHGVLHGEDTVSVQLAMVLSQFWDWLEVTMWPNLGNLPCCEAFF